MLCEEKIWVGQGENPCYLLLNQANRHGLIAGASGTGKTVTLKVLAEAFSQTGVPVFMADVKGDITGLVQPGAESESVANRVAKLGIGNWSFSGCPCRFWEVAGVGAGASGARGGMPVRLMVSQMGPTLLARLLGLNDVQEGVLNIVFRVADDLDMLVIDLKDLRAMLGYVAEHSSEYTKRYGNVSSASVGAIQRALIAIEDQGGNEFFGEPAIDLADWFACDESGAGYVNILNAERLIQSPRIYAMLLLWMMSDLFESLPEVGDLSKPKFVFFFDEAHLLFDGMPKELVGKIIQVVKLIRSKGVGIYFITQNPSDIPDEVLAQLSNRIQHGLRAYTPAEQKAVRAAAASLRANPQVDSEKAILDLGTGEALVSLLDEEGRPSVVERAQILPPQCLMGAASAQAIEAAIASERELRDKYATAVDRKSAYEIVEGIEAPDASGGVGECPSAPKEGNAWTCACGAQNEGKFCMDCGKPRPAAPAASGAWTCACGAENEGKFCVDCGAARPWSAAAVWRCNCGQTNEGAKFCSACGQSYEQGIKPKEQKRSEAPEAKAQATAADRKAEKAATAAEKAEAKKKEQREAQAMKTASSIIGQVGRTAASTLTRGFLNNLLK